MTLASQGHWSDANPQDGRLPAQGEQVLRLAAGAERLSEHPLARAILEQAEKLGLQVPSAETFASETGKGIRARVQGHQVLVGSPAWIAETVPIPDELNSRLEAQSSQGRTLVAVAVDGQIQALLAIADALKPEARQTVARLHQEGIETVMLTGDRQATAETIAAAVGIDQVYAQVLPGDKATIVRRLQAQGVRVAMVGDGINDAPALMQADVGIAIGAGTDIAIEAADIVLVGERLSAVLDAYYIARASYRKTLQNLILAFAFNGLGVPLAVTGLVAPFWAMIAMVASVSTVLLNSFGGRLIPKRSAVLPEPSTPLAISVPTIHCQGCVENIQAALLKLPGVTAVQGDPTSKRLLVSLNPAQAGEAQIRETLARLGHVVAQVTPADHHKETHR
jgi:cation transport ATPase